MGAIRIQLEDFDPGVEMEALTQGRTDVGAVASFVGIVRGDDALEAMTLEAYEAFALREITAHVADAKQRWPLLDVTVIHRAGRLTPGARIVFVGVASAHRGDAFRAAEFLMDYLKTRAPFWKLEEKSSGANWVEPRASDDTAAQRWK